MVFKFTFHLALQWISRLLYLSGLSVIIPFIFTANMPSELLWFQGKALILIVLATLLFIAGVLGIHYSAQKRDKSTFISLAWITFIPAVLALFFSIFGRKTILSLLSRYIFEWQKVEPLVVSSLDRSVPKIWVLTISYLIISIIFFKLGSTNKK